MKKEISSATPSPVPTSNSEDEHASDTEYKPSLSSSPKRKAAPSSKANTTPKKAKGPSSSGGSPGSGWTPDKKEAIIARLLTLGIKVAKLDELCAEFGLTKNQLSNQLQTGHKGNLRDKAAKAARGI